jgi:chromosomal replication initiation ATPase DnaA
MYLRRKNQIVPRDIFEHCLYCVCSEFHVDVDDLVSRKRNVHGINARRMMVHILLESGYTISEVQRAFLHYIRKGMTHVVILNLNRAFCEQLNTDPDLAIILNNIEKNG